MSTSFETEAGFGIRFELDPDNLSDPKYDELKKFIWKNLKKGTKKYFDGKKSNAFHSDYFDMETVKEAFPDLTIVWCGNPYSSTDESWWFAVADTTHSKFDYGYQDLSQKTTVSAMSFAQLEVLKVAATDGGSPRWYTWMTIG